MLAEVEDADCHFEVEHAAKTVQNMKRSLSWRITAPLRRIKRYLG